MGMNVGGGKKGGAVAEINVTPLIDIVLVLLIIFMVLTPSMLKELTANVPPKSEDNTPPPPGTEPVVIEINEKSELAINTEPIAPENLATQVQDRLRTRKDKIVFFKVHDLAVYGDVVRFMDIAKGAGATMLGIVTRDAMGPQQ
jgi:biopolymer transport protein TolR